jgi:hypothetical protein
MLQKWRQLGGKYHHLASRIGMGRLVHMCRVLNESQMHYCSIEKEKDKGRSRLKAITSLKVLDIPALAEKSGAERVMRAALEEMYYRFEGLESRLV